ncbi:MAG: VWA domain-containing protein [Cyanobacteria bacterium J06649_4]
MSTTIAFSTRKRSSRKPGLNQPSLRKLCLRALSLSIFPLGFYLGAPAIANVPSNIEISGTPTVEDDEVTVRISVTDEENRPVVGLQDDDFQLTVDNQPFEFDSRNWKRPEDTVPPPAWIIVLLDMSGSMTAEDGQGTTKIEGALGAIRQFKDAIAQRTENLPDANVPQIAIVPFGESGPGCAGFRVTDEQLQRFFSAKDYLLENQLLFLESQTPCASTNLYEPVRKAVAFLGNTENPDFYVEEDSPEPDPRLSIILLSDGYHNGGDEAEAFDQLKTDLRRNPDIIIHTLGYGLTPAELGTKYNLGGPATRASINAGQISADEFVDEVRLAEIAQLTGGISEFSGNAEAVVDKLQLFLSALLGEYEIRYTQPNADRGSTHSVQATVTTAESTLQSTPKDYKIRTHGLKALPGKARAGLFAGTLGTMGLFGVLPFWLWANKLKKEDW